jgi:microcystin-dependent protein
MNLAVLSDGSVPFTAPEAITIAAATGNPGLTISQVNNTTNGAQLKLVGNGATTPSKTLRVLGGTLNVLNDAGTTSILTLTDGGNITVPGTVTSGAIVAPSVTTTGNITSSAGIVSGNIVQGNSANFTNIQKGGNELLPTGIICLWYGSTASIPAGWHLCDGTSGTIDLRDKFIVCAGLSYAVGATGGAATYSLSVAQMPAHNHGVNDPTHNHGDSGHSHGVNDPSHSHGTQTYLTGTNGSGGSTSGYGSFSPSTGSGTYGAYTGISIQTGYASIAAAYTGITTANNGSGASIENRPPYYALAFIMKL